MLYVVFIPLIAASLAADSLPNGAKVQLVIQDASLEHTDILIPSKPSKHPSSLSINSVYLLRILSSVIVCTNKGCGVITLRVQSTQTSTVATVNIQNASFVFLHPQFLGLPAATVDGFHSHHISISLSGLHRLESWSIPGSITPVPDTMSSSTSPLDIGGTQSPNSPVSPKTVPGPDGYFSPAPNSRLESITEHVKADHARPRASSSGSISFKSAPKVPESPLIGKPKRQPLSRFRGASPPPAR